MLVEAAVVLCLTNATNTAVSGLVRDGRSKVTSAKLEGTSLTYREPLNETPFPAVEARQTGCLTLDSLSLAKPQLVIWSGRPLTDGDTIADHEGNALCRPTAPPRAGQRLTFVYRKGLFGQLTCKEIR